MRYLWDVGPFGYRGKNELARYSRFVWRQPGFRIGRLRVPLGAKRLWREEMLGIRGPWGAIWSDEHEQGYRKAMKERYP